VLLHRQTAFVARRQRQLRRHRRHRRRHSRVQRGAACCVGTASWALCLRFSLTMCSFARLSVVHCNWLAFNHKSVSELIVIVKM